MHPGIWVDMFLAISVLLKAQGEKQPGKFMLTSGEFALCQAAALNEPLIYNEACTRCCPNFSLFLKVGYTE